MKKQLLSPVRLKIKFLANCIAFNRFNSKDAPVINPTESFEEHLFTVANSGDYRALFIIGEDGTPRFLYGPIGAFRLLFEPEPFLEIMEKYPRKDRLVFFRHAELPNIKEANKFLALVENSDQLTPKDRDRAYTWMQQMVKRQNLK